MSRIADNKDLLHEIIDELLNKKRIDRPKFFRALDIVHEIARDCSGQCVRIQHKNTKLQQQNNTLTWLVISQASTAGSTH